MDRRTDVVARVPARFLRGGGRDRPGPRRHPPPQAPRQLARLRARPRLPRSPARADLRLADPRVRHDRPPAHRSSPRRRARLRRPGARLPRPGDATPARRGVQPRGVRAPDVPGGPRRRADACRCGRRGGPLVRPALAPAGRGAGLRRVRGARQPGRPQPQGPGGRRLRGPRHGPLARPRRRRLAAGCRLRRPPGVLARGRRPGARAAPRRLVRGRVPARRGRRDPGVHRPRRGHRLRPVEAAVAVAERPELLRPRSGRSSDSPSSPASTHR